MAYCTAEVDAPISGKPSEVLEAIVTVTNTHTLDWIFITEIWAGTLLIDSIEDLIAAGASVTYYRSFNMPGSAVTVLAWVERVVSIFDSQTEYACSASADIMTPPTSITIDVPAEAIPGSTVPVTARVQNISGTYFSVRTLIWAPYTGDISSSTQIWDETVGLNPGDSWTFRPSFLMPSSDTQVYVGTWIWVYRDAYGWHWEVDNWEIADVQAKAPEPEFANFGISEYNRL